MSRTVATFSLAGALLLTGVATATAAEYPASPAQCGVSTGSVGVGGTVGFSCGGMTPDEAVTVTTTCTPGTEGAARVTRATIVADSSGAVTHTAVADTAGVCVLAAEDPASGAAGTAAVTVTGAFSAQSAPGTGGAGIGAGTDTGAGTGAGTDTGTGTGAAASGTDGSGLAATGADSSLAMWGAAGVGALALGTAAITVSRRRRSGTAA